MYLNEHKLDIAAAQKNDCDIQMKEVKKMPKKDTTSPQGEGAGSGRGLGGCRVTKRNNRHRHFGEQSGLGNCRNQERNPGRTQGHGRCQRGSGQGFKISDE